jgi:hypothetical protein
MRYKLRTLLIVLALGPPVLAGAYMFAVDSEGPWGVSWNNGDGTITIIVLEKWRLVRETWPAPKNSN